MVSTVQNFPASDAPIVDREGRLTQEGRSLLESLWSRTGLGPGVDVTTVEQTADSAALAAAAAIAGANASLKKAQNLFDLANIATARINLGLTALAVAAPVAGWVDPTGVGLRTTFDMNWTITVGAAYVQAEITAIRDQLIAVQKRLGQLILDEKTVGTLAT